MAERYIPAHDFVCADKQGQRRMFHVRHRRPDGTFGYTPDEVKGLFGDHLRMFRVVEVTGDEVVEQATAAPGEKRAARPRNTK